MQLLSGKPLKCSMCNYIVDKLVPLYDDDQLHKKQQCCQKCKRKIKKGERIVKFVRVEENDEN